MSKRENREAFVADDGRGLLACIERAVVPARPQGMGERNLGKEVPGKRPRGKEKSSHACSH